jgi:hypothetical protein
MQWLVQVKLQGLPNIIHPLPWYGVNPELPEFDVSYGKGKVSQQFGRR